MAAEGFSAVPKRVGGKSFRQGPSSEVRGSVENDSVGGCAEPELPVRGEFRFGFETAGTGFGSRVALHGEPGCFCGDEEENVVTLQAGLVGVLGLQPWHASLQCKNWILKITTFINLSYCVD